MPGRQVFISNSHQDQPFVERLEQRLQQEGIDTWRDEKAAVAGRLERQINDAIFEKDALLLVFSKHSCGSDWVEWEASRAREVEKKQGRDVLCPIALDDAWKTATWHGPLQFQIQDYNILDFSDPGRFDEMVERLIAGLRRYYGPSTGETAEAELVDQPVTVSMKRRGDHTPPANWQDFEDLCPIGCQALPGGHFLARAIGCGEFQVPGTC